MKIVTYSKMAILSAMIFATPLTQAKRVSFLKHCGVHFLTDILSYGAFIPAIGIGASIYGSQSDCACLVKGSAVAATLLGALYVHYKTPQWTDTYILGLETERTFEQNIFTLFIRTILSLPIGILVGENMVRLDQEEDRIRLETT
jgi:hypothetical protein